MHAKTGVSGGTTRNMPSPALSNDTCRSVGRDHKERNGPRASLPARVHLRAQVVAAAAAAEQVDPGRHARDAVHEEKRLHFGAPREPAWAADVGCRIKNEIVFVQYM